MKTISLKLPSRLSSRLDQAAKQRGQSKSEIVRTALEQFLNGAQSGQRPLSALELAGDLVGCADGPSDLATNPQLALAFRERVVQHRVDELTKILEQGVEQGDIRPDAEIEIANELLFGPIYYRLLLSGKPLTRGFAERLVDVFLASAAAPPRTRRKRPPPKANRS